MSILTITTILLIVTLTVLQIMTFRLQLWYRILLQALVLTLCAYIANSILLANYANRVANEHAEQIYALPNDYLSDNYFKATVESAKFVRKDTFVISLRFDPHEIPSYSDPAPTVQGVRFELLSPNDVGMMSRAPRYILGSLIWIPSLFFGWMFHTLLARRNPVN